VHLKLVQHLLGNSTVALTLNTYSHVTPGLSGEAARTMNQLFGGGTSRLAAAVPMPPAPTVLEAAATRPTATR